MPVLKAKPPDELKSALFPLLPREHPSPTL